MTCKKIEDRLPAYIEGSLCPEEKEAIARHLAACSRCRRAVADLKKATELLRNIAEVEPPPFFEQKVMSQIKEEAGQRKGLLRKIFYPLYIKVPIQALASILIAVLGFYVYQTGEPEMKQMVSVPPPMNESAKDQIKVDSQKSVATPPSIIKDRQAAVVHTNEMKQQPLVPPPLIDSSKDSRIGDSPERMKEEIPSEAKPSVMAEKEAVPIGAVALKQERAGKQEAEKIIDVPVPKQKRTEMVAQADSAAAAGERRRMAASPAPLRLMTSVAVEKPALDLTIRVKDKETALREIEECLGHLKARNIERKKGDDRVTLKALLDSLNVSALLDRLETIGSVQKKSVVSPEGDVTVSIMIIENP